MTTRTDRHFRDENPTDVDGDAPDVSEPAAPPAPPPAPSSAPPADVPTDAGVSDAAAALARRKHERAREVETDRPVRMVDLHDLERATDERLSELDRRFAAVRAPAVPGTVPAPAAPVLAPRRRLSAVAPWVAVAVLLAVVVVAYVRGTRGGTR